MPNIIHIIILKHFMVSKINICTWQALNNTFSVGSWWYRTSYWIMTLILQHWHLLNWVESTELSWIMTLLSSVAPYLQLKLTLFHNWLTLEHWQSYWTELTLHKDLPPFVTVAMSVKPRRSHSEKYIVEQRGNWQRAYTQHRAGYFWYETKYQLSNFVLF